jgi:hypothetical protein
MVSRSIFIDSSASSGGDGLSSAAAFDSWAALTAISATVAGWVAANDDVTVYVTGIFYEIVTILPGSADHPIYYVPQGTAWIDGTVSIDGDWTFSPSGTYSETKSWVNVSGEVWSKDCYDDTHLMLEDGEELTPLASTDIVNEISRGEFCHDHTNNKLYYRASDGAAPSTHELRMARRDNESNPLVAGDSYTYWGIGVRYAMGRTVDDSPALGFSSKTGITVDAELCKSTYCLLLEDTTNAIVGGHIHHGQFRGVYIEGDSAGYIRLTGMNLHDCGNALIYTHSTQYDYRGDADGVGIGGKGGTIASVEIIDSKLLNVGISGNDTAGAAVACMTENTMAVSILTIRGCYFNNNAVNIISTADDLDDIYLIGNYFTGHFQTTDNRSAVQPYVANNAYIYHNIWWNNDGYSCLFFKGQFHQNLEKQSVCQQRPCHQLRRRYYFKCCRDCRDYIGL